MILPIIALLVILILVGFGLTYLPIDPGIKNLIRGIVILLAILFVIYLVLIFFGLAPKKF